MTYISIHQLKKEAKNLRKNNNAIKNHNESLDAIAKKYGYKKWVDLLNHTELKIATPSVEKTTLSKEELKEKALTEFAKDCNLLFDYLKNKDASVLSNHFNEMVKKMNGHNKHNTGMWYERSAKLVYAMCELFIHRKDNSMRSFNQLLNQNITELLSEAYSVEPQNKQLIRSILDLLPLKNENLNNLSEIEINNDIETHYGFLTMMFTPKIKNIYTIFNESTKENPMISDLVSIIDNDIFNNDINNYIQYIESKA